jgi:restriction endonuclease Mrr
LYTDGNLETFREEYEEMSVHERAMENKPLTAGTIIGIAAMLAFLFTVLPV